MNMDSNQVSKNWDFCRWDNQREIQRLMKVARSYANLTQAQLAKRMKTTQSGVARMENDPNGCTIKQAEKYIEACGFFLRLHHISIQMPNGSHTSFVGRKN